jgi:hypothetical protein
MLTKRLYCLKCNREAQDNDEYYHCPGCGQYQQVVFYELQEGRRPEQRFEWRDVEVRQRAENPEPIHNSGRGVLEVIQPLAIREQQKRDLSTLKGVDMSKRTGEGGKEQQTPVKRASKPAKSITGKPPVEKISVAPSDTRLPKKADVQGEVTAKVESTPTIKPRGIGGRPRKKGTRLCAVCGVRACHNAYDVCKPCFDQAEKRGEIDYERLAKEIVRELYRHLSTKYVTFQVNEGAL